MYCFIFILNVFSCNGPICVWMSVCGLISIIVRHLFLLLLLLVLFYPNKSPKK